MADFPPSAHVLKRVVVGLGSELAPILSLEMEARDVLASHTKHATRKPVKVQSFVNKLCLRLRFRFFLFCSCVLKMLAINLVKKVILPLGGWLFAHSCGYRSLSHLIVTVFNHAITVLFVCDSDGAWRVFSFQRML